MYPHDVRTGDNGFVKFLRILHAHFFYLLSSPGELLLFFQNMLVQPPLAAEALDIIFRPEDGVVGVLGQILDHVVPFGLLALLILPKQIHQQYIILPVAVRSLREQVWVFLEDAPDFTEEGISGGQHATDGNLNQTLVGADFLGGH